MSVTIRTVVDGDNVKISEVLSSVAHLYNPFMPGAFERQAKLFKESGIPSKYEIRVIEKESNTIGFIGTKLLSEDILYLVALYIHDNYQGKGFGKEVLRIIENDYRDNSIKHIILQVHQKADWAKRFYQSMNYQEVNQTEAFEFFRKNLNSFYIENSIMMMKHL